MQITYQKRDGSIMQKYRNTMLPYDIGDTTSMGWKVLNIEYEYKDKWYSKEEYDKLIQKNKERYIRKNQIKELCIKETKTLLYYFIVITILYYIRIRIGI
ncbi:MAG: hypothetical protein IJI98_11040 [Methanosphaera sp.]|nr:hypothetical protein [Clostridia bacterium]MBR0473214.1 hypothetical protein [Methanosphaera sp.]